MFCRFKAHIFLEYRSNSGLNVHPPAMYPTYSSELEDTATDFTNRSGKSVEGFQESVPKIHVSVDFRPHPDCGNPPMTCMVDVD